MNQYTKENMLAIFREAIPEISRDAAIVFVNRGRFFLGEDSEEIVELQRYKVPGPGKSVFEFSIARALIPKPLGELALFAVAPAPEREIVFVLRIPDEELPEGSIGEFYIKQYSAPFRYTNDFGDTWRNNP